MRDESLRQLVEVLAMVDLADRPLRSAALGHMLPEAAIEQLAAAARDAVSGPVLALHRPCHTDGPCELRAGYPCGPGHFGEPGCVECRETWPCPTVQALYPGGVLACEREEVSGR